MSFTITYSILKSNKFFKTVFNKRYLGSYSNAIERRSELFNIEQKRQNEKVGRIEKIEVRYLGLPEDKTLIMNKGLSTPFNCTQHLGENHIKQSALALLDSRTPWDMHRPLEESCTLQLLHFTQNDPYLVNRAFWRTCSFLLGSVLQESFRETAGLHLHSFPSPNIKSGSFLHDIVLKNPDWIPNKAELRALSAGMVKLSAKNLPIERLEVDHDVAFEMFKNNPFKREQLPSISQQNNGRIVLYRAGDHIDISRGPMIGNTSHLGKCTISSIHKIATENDLTYYRVQGVALPIGFILNHFSYGILENRSKNLNSAKLPNEHMDESYSESAIA